MVLLFQSGNLYCEMNQPQEYKNHNRESINDTYLTPLLYYLTMATCFNRVFTVFALVVFATITSAAPSAKVAPSAKGSLPRS